MTNIILYFKILQVILISGCKDRGEEKYIDLAAHERQRVLDLAESYLDSPVITVTAEYFI